MDMLDTLHNEVAKRLLDRIKSKDATSADFNAAIKFLKDNSISFEPAPADPEDTIRLLGEAMSDMDLPEFPS